MANFNLEVIGIALAEKISELLTTGHLPYYETLNSRCRGIAGDADDPRYGSQKSKPSTTNSAPHVGELEMPAQRPVWWICRDSGEKPEKFTRHRPPQATSRPVSVPRGRGTAQPCSMPSSIQMTVRVASLVACVDDRNRRANRPARQYPGEERLGQQSPATLVQEVLVTETLSGERPAAEGVKANVHLMDDVNFPSPSIGSLGINLI